MERNSIQGAEESPRERGVRPPLRIMFLGKSGVGKSACANTIFGRSVFRSELKTNAVTKECQMEIHRVDDREITVIDSIGIFELSEKKPNEIVENILKFLRRNQPGPHVFLLVGKVETFMQEDINTNKVIERYFGPKVWDHTIFLFTHGDSLEGKPLERVIIESDKNLRDIIRKCAGGYYIFNNKEKEDQSQVTKLLEMIDCLVAVNGGECYPIDLYPEQEQKIWTLKADYMKKQNKRITSEEKQLRSTFKGQEFERKKVALWKKEEELAWQYAEYWIQYTSIFYLPMWIGAQLKHIVWG